MKMTTKEWVRHLKHYVKTHGFSASDKSYMLVVLERIEKSLKSSEFKEKSEPHSLEEKAND